MRNVVNSKLQNNCKENRMGKGRLSTKYRILLSIVVIVLAFTACGRMREAVDSPVMEEQGEGVEVVKDRVDTGFILTGPDSYDSADTPIIVGMDKEQKTITFLNRDINRRYTLSYDGTTKLYDKYGEGISLGQVQPGDIVDITFLKSKKHLTDMRVSSEAWSYSNVERYEINNVRGEVFIGDEVYKLSDNTQYFSGGTAIEEMDLISTDVLTFRGIGSSILSIQVDKGHGYLRLVNDENFIDGWIEIGQTMIQRITDDMLLTVPEGSYQVNISHNGGGGIKNVVVNRNKETILDIGDLEVAEVKYGTVLFSLNPSNAEVYIDGSKIDASQPVSLEYGLHQIIAKADGYSSLTQYIRVGQESAGLDVVLDALDENSDKEKNEDSTDKDSKQEASSNEAVTSYYKVYIDAPESAEVYLDGNYVGISPCSFRKNSGSYVITLRKTGYETRSYTIQVDDEDKDISYSFADLVESAKASGAESVVGEATVSGSDT